MILIDSNILIDVLGDDLTWRIWSVDRIAELAGYETLRINQIVIAEVAPRFEGLDAFYQVIAAFDIAVEEMTDEGVFLAGCAFQLYRRNKGGAGTVLPDFLIGGHAQAAGASILTRDRRFYEAYFPGVSLIAPSKDVK